VEWSTEWGGKVFDIICDYNSLAVSTEDQTGMYSSEEELLMQVVDRMICNNMNLCSTTPYCLY
jgi:hypothetical protein